MPDQMRVTGEIMREWAPHRDARANGAFMLVAKSCTSATPRRPSTACLGRLRASQDTRAYKTQCMTKERSSASLPSAKRSTGRQLNKPPHGLLNIRRLQQDEWEFDLGFGWVVAAVVGWVGVWGVWAGPGLVWMGCGIFAAALLWGGRLLAAGHQSSRSQSLLVRWGDAWGCGGERASAWASSGRGQLQQACGFTAV